MCNEYAQKVCSARHPKTKKSKEERIREELDADQWIEAKQKKKFFKENDFERHARCVEEILSDEERGM